MRRILAAAWIVMVAATSGAIMRADFSGRANRREARGVDAAMKNSVAGHRAKGLGLPLAFEPSAAGAIDGVEFEARAEGMEVGLGREGMVVKFPARGTTSSQGEMAAVRIGFTSGETEAANLKWIAEEKEAGETNYFIGRDARRWRLHVPRYGRAEAEIFEGVRAAAYGNAGKVEYDLRVTPGTDLDALGLKIDGAERVRLNAEGELEILAAGRKLEMRKPQIFVAPGARQIDGGYVMRTDGGIGFWVGAHDAGATIMIDPTLAMEYATFLGGAGGTQVNGAAVDAGGNLYVSGETEAGESFGGAAGQSEGVTGGSSYLFVAKLDPGASGEKSLEWLTFIGGSGSQAGGAVAVSAAPGSAGTNVVIAGSTTSADYPVTDGSTLGTGGNSEVVTELLDPDLLGMGPTLAFSTMLGGNGTEENENARGVAIDSNGNLYVASDTTSANLCTGAATTTPYQATYGGGATDGFLAMYTPGASPSLRYCSYLGIFAEVGVTGLAVDSKENAYLAGFTSQPVNPTQFPSTANGFQPNYGGGNYDGFLVKISPSGQGASDLSYATYLGGTGSDKAMAIAVDSSSLPATAYVVGTTDSEDFPQGGLAGYQTTQGAGLGGTNAFLAVVRQSAQPPASGPDTQLAYSTYVGGLRNDAGLSVAEVAPNAVYVGGSANSTNFPWLDNLQPLNGDADAFVAGFDTTVAGSAGLKFATPLGGTPTPGVTVTTAATALAALKTTSGNGNVQIYIVGTTNASDFPQAPEAAGPGLELTCASCPGEADGFAAEILETPTGTAGASVSFDPSVVRMTATTEFAPVNVAIRNSGDGVLTISSVTLSQAGSDFSLQPANPCEGMTIQAGSTSLCSFAVSYTPSSAQTEGATIFVADDAPGGTQELQVAGISGVAQASVSPGILSFGNTAIGMESGPQYVTVLNAGGQALAVSQYSTSSSAYLVEAAGSGCTTVPAGAACAMKVWFSPATAGAANATLTITDNSGNISGTTQTVALTGTGVSGGPEATVAPGSLNFGTVNVGATSAAQSVTLENSGSSTLDVSSIVASGGGFSIASGAATTCPVGGGTLAPGASCAVGVTFTPGTSGAASGGLNFFDNAGGGEQSVALAGTGASAGTVSMAPASVTFAPQSMGTTSAATNVTFANMGNAAVTITSIGVTGAEAGDFGATSNCGAGVAAGKSCVIQVTFSPAAAGSRSATLSVADSASGSPQTVALSGTGTQAGVKLSATSVTFSAAQLMGTPSTAQPVTLTSNGTGPLAISKISFTGSDAADFSASNPGAGNCAAIGGVTVQAGQSCTVSVVFTPQAQSPQCGGTAGARCASMMITDNAPDSPQTVTLEGSAMDFEIAPPAGGSLAQTVTAGGTATYNLEIDSSGGFAGNVSIGCSEATAITGTSCSVPAGSVNVAANGAGTFTVSVTTTASGTGSSAMRKRSDAANFKFEIGNLKWKTVGAVALLTALGMIFGPIKKRRYVTGACLFAVMVACASCGGGGANTATDPPGTPTGTYANAVTVTATYGTGANAATRTAGLTLIVQ